MRVDLPASAGGHHRDALATHSKVVTAMTKHNRCRTNSRRSWRTPIETHPTCDPKSLPRW
jgi:hypothetical protein